MSRLIDTGNFIYSKIDTSKYFSEREAWSCFRLAAFGEAIGWTLLILGISIKYLFLKNNNSSVLIAGRIHGVLFLTYFVAVLIFFSVLKWTRRQTLIAALASIPPYGTLLFEQWMAHKRRKANLKTYRQIVVRGIIIRNHELLVVQPRDRGFWCLPGAKVSENESIEQSLQRSLFGQFAKKAKIGELMFTNEYNYRGNPRLELFFKILNVDDYKNVVTDSFIKSSVEYEDIKFVKDIKKLDIEPKMLREFNLKNDFRKN